MWSHLFAVGLPVSLFVEFFIFGPQVEDFKSIMFGIVLLLVYAVPLSETYRLHKVNNQHAISYSIIAGVILSFFAFWLGKLVDHTVSDSSVWFDNPKTYSIFTIVFTSIFYGFLIESIPAITIITLNRQQFYSSTDALTIGSITNASAYILPAFMYFSKIATFTESSFQFFLIITAKFVVEIVMQRCLGSLTAYRMDLELFSVRFPSCDNTKSNFFRAIIPAASINSIFRVLSGFFESYLPLGDQRTGKIFLTFCSFVVYFLVTNRMRKYHNVCEDRDVCIQESQNQSLSAEELLSEQKKKYENSINDLQKKFKKIINNMLKEQKKKEKSMDDQRIEYKSKFSILEKKNIKLVEENLVMNEKFRIVYDELLKIAPNTGKQKYCALISQATQCARAILNLEIPTDSFFEWFLSKPTIQTMNMNMNELVMVTNYVKEITRISRAFNLKDTLSSTFESRFTEITNQSPIAKIANEKSYAKKLEEFKELDIYFETFKKCLQSFRGKEADYIQQTVKLLINTHSDLEKQNEQTIQMCNSVRSAITREEEIPFTLDQLNELRKQLDQHYSRLIACECVHFEGEIFKLKKRIEEKLNLLNLTINELSVFVNLRRTLNMLHLSSIRFPLNPKIIGLDSYMNGQLENCSKNQRVVKDDRLIKCICVSDEFEGNMDINLRTLRRELHVLSKLYPSTVTLKNVVLVPKTMRDPTSPINFVCIELERANYDLVQYLSAFPNINAEERNYLAHQLVIAVSIMHSNNIVLCELNPENVFIYCGGGGTNPILKLGNFKSSISRDYITETGNFEHESADNFLSDIYALGETISYIFAQDANALALRDDCAHTEILQLCRAQDTQLRPSAHKLSLYNWHKSVPATQERLTLIRTQINQFIVAKQALLRDNEHDGSTMEFEQTTESFDELFVNVFTDTSTFMSGAEYFGASITMHGMEKLSIAQFADHVFEYRSFLHFDTNASDDLIEAVCGFLYCCFVLQSPVDDIQVGQFLLNALSADYNKLSDAIVFNRVFPTESAYISNMLKHEGLNFNFIGGEDIPVTSDNINEFLKFARESASEPWAELSKKVNTKFNSFELNVQLDVTLTFNEVKNLICGPPRFTAEQVLVTFAFSDEVPSEIHDALKEVLEGFNSLDMLQFVYWMNGSPELNSFTVILQPDDTMLPSVALCDRTLRLPNSVLRVREGLPLAIRGILPNEFKLLIMQRLSQWTQKDVDELNNRLKNAPLKRIDFNEIDDVPSVRVCPSCLTPIEHGGACKSMKCFTCTREFCFSCLAPDCGHYGQCDVAAVQELTLNEVNERMSQFQ
ncbi:hypothetical protein PCE1_002776 [Barthelona sp. PCE]